MYKHYCDFCEKESPEYRTFKMFRTISFGEPISWDTSQTYEYDICRDCWNKLNDYAKSLGKKDKK